jgi:glutaminase
MINVGAITAVSLIPAATPDQRFDRILDFHSECAGRRLSVDQGVYASVKATGSRNRAIAYMLDSFGILGDDPDEVLDVYFRQCSIKATSTDLARMAATLARGGRNPISGTRVTTESVVRRTLSVMTTCGMYDGTGEWVDGVGMPAKSGVGGGTIAALPNQLGIGVYSPLLDHNGNSVRGIRVCRSLSARLGLHFLSVTREARSIIRATYDADDGIRVYELHGDLLFSGAEQVLRIIEGDQHEVDVAILELARIDDINDVARDMLASMREMLNAAGKEGFIVDPEHAVVTAGGHSAIAFRTLAEAIDAARTLRGR